jgi:hypothetical protein
LSGTVKKGFQAIENLAGHKYGMCGWWSNFIVELCCLQPDIPFEDIYFEASQLLSDNPEKLFSAIMKYQYNLQQIIIEIAKKDGFDINDRTNIENLYSALSVRLFHRIADLLLKRKDILGYARPVE